MIFDFSIKYEPKKLSEMILPEELIKKLEPCFQEQFPFPYMLVGSTGVGKTTIVKNLRDEPYLINCLNGCDDDDLHNLERAASAFTLNDRRRLIVLDDVDHMLPKYQLHLIDILDKFRINNDFVFTAREPYRLKQALRSRIQEIEFEFSGSKEHKERIVEFLADIASQESDLEVELDDLDYLVDQAYPDIRKMMRCLQDDLFQANFEKQYDSH
jgi:replication-associated recombination protein RarA